MRLARDLTSYVDWPKFRGIFGIVNALGPRRYWPNARASPKRILTGIGGVERERQLAFWRSYGYRHLYLRCISFASRINMARETGFFFG